MVTQGQIVRNLIPSQPVIINKVQNLVTNNSYYLLDKCLKPVPPAPPTPPELPIEPPVKPPVPPEPKIKKFKLITVSGKVPVEKYLELFTCFITPFAMSGNKLDIEVMFRIKTTESSPLDKTKQQYKSAKEAAKQLGLDFEEEE